MSETRTGLGNQARSAQLATPISAATAILLVLPVLSLFITYPVVASGSDHALSWTTRTLAPPVTPQVPSRPSLGYHHSSHARTRTHFPASPPPYLP
ncbi:hypothetical protein LY78DRAFT_747968, partial [Colletotrichum sublineola]